MASESVLPPFVTDYARQLSLSAHPEGGFFKETYRSPEVFPIDSPTLPLRSGELEDVLRKSPSVASSPKDLDFPAGRPHSTSISFVLHNANGAFSGLHRLRADEIWYVHDATPGAYLLVSGFKERRGDDGKVTVTLTEKKLGKDLEKGYALQGVSERGEWFGSRVMHPDGGPNVSGEVSALLMGCTVSPGFVFEDFETPTKAGLRKRWEELGATVDPNVWPVVDALVRKP